MVSQKLLIGALAAAATTLAAAITVSVVFATKDNDETTTTKPVTGQPDTTINVETTLADITTTTLAEQETTTTIMVTEPPEQTTTSEAEDTTTTTIKATTEPEQIITTSVEETTTETNGNNIETAPPEATIDPAMTETAVPVTTTEESTTADNGEITTTTISNVNEGQQSQQTSVGNQGFTMAPVVGNQETTMEPVEEPLETSTIITTTVTSTTLSPCPTTTRAPAVGVPMIMLPSMPGWGAFAKSANPNDYGDYAEEIVDPCDPTSYNECGSNLTDVTFEEITTPGYGTINYPRHMNCTWFVTVSEGSKILIDFPDFDVTVGDSLFVTDLDFHQDPIKMLQKSYGNDDLPSPILLSGNKLRLDFILSKCAIWTAPGFKLSVTKVDASHTLNVDPSQYTFDTIDDCDKKFEYIDFGIVEAKGGSWRFYCKWRIHVLSGKNILLDFAPMTIPDGDYVKVGNATDYPYESYLNFTGDNLPNQYLVEDNYVLLEYMMPIEKRGNFTQVGFKFNFTQVDPPDADVAIMWEMQQTTTMSPTVTTGTPCPTTTMVWGPMVPMIAPWAFPFPQVGKSADPDYGDDYADPCTTTTTTTTRKPMFTDCGGNLTDITYEEITSPNFPDDYPSSVNCTWLITVPEGSKIQIDFANFSMNGGGDLLVYDLDFHEDYVKKFFGSSSYGGPKHSLLTNGRKLQLNFQMDRWWRDTTDSGFNLSVTRVDASHSLGIDPEHFTIRSCSYNVLRMDFAIVIPTDTYNNSACSYRFYALSGKHILIDIKPITIPEGDSVMITENGWPYENATYYNETDLPTQILIENDFVEVRYYFADSNRYDKFNATGFSFNFTQVDEQPPTVSNAIEESTSTSTPFPCPTTTMNLGMIQNLIFFPFVGKSADPNYDYGNYDDPCIPVTEPTTEPVTIPVPEGYIVNPDGSRSFVDCGGNFSDQASGEISSPMDPDSDYDSLYPNDSNCTWTITVPDGFKILLQFKNSSIETTYDYLRIYDTGPPEVSKINITGYDLPTDILSMGNSLKLVFTSDGSVQKEGFQLDFLQVDNTYTTSTTTTTTIADPCAEGGGMAFKSGLSVGKPWTNNRVSRVRQALMGKSADPDDFDYGNNYEDDPCSDYTTTSVNLPPMPFIFIPTEQTGSAVSAPPYK